MDERYMITVVGKQTVDGESEKIEVITEGSMTVDSGRVTIVYPEYRQDDPSQKTDTTVELSGGVLSIDRTGEMSSHLILERGTRHECLYQTPMGSMLIGIFTDSLRSDIDEHGGEISASYQLDFNSAVVSFNEIYILVKEK